MIKPGRGELLPEIVRVIDALPGWRCFLVCLLTGVVRVRFHLGGALAPA